MTDYARDWQRNQDPTLDDPSQYSGVVTLPGIGDDARTPSVSLIGPKVGLLNARHRQRGLTGLASVSIHVKDISVAASAHDPNYRILCDLSWQSGRGGGEATVDIQRGSVFTIGAANSINAKVYYAIGDPTLPFTATITKQIDAVVHWGGTISPKAALMSSVALHAASGVSSTTVDIPKCARAMMVMGTPFASLAQVRADFRTAGGRIVSDVTNPFANGSPIVFGFESVSFFNGSAVDVTVIPVWELWL